MLFAIPWLLTHLIGLSNQFTSDFGIHMVRNKDVQLFRTNKAISWKQNLTKEANLTVKE